MAKTYIDIVKYMVEAQFEISGLAEKPDIIGAVFGQTEGLLGGGLDLRELQKNGKIGRIEIETSPSGNRTMGKLYLPSSLGRVETCILGATIESVDRVGPFETSFKVLKIEDTRNDKRRKIVNRAKELLKRLLTTEIPDSKEISELVEEDVKSSVVTTYGPENLPAGPDIDGNEELILVEGRADVINLLKNDINNCIAVGGATGNIPKTIIELSKSKETTLFLDGDRGGDMIMRGLSNVCDVDFVVRAPDGKEVEELTRKDIIKSLRTKVPIEQALSRLRNGEDRQFGGRGRNQRDRHEPPREQIGMSQSRPNLEQVRGPLQDHDKPRQDAPQYAQPYQSQERSSQMPQRREMPSEHIMSPSEISRKIMQKEPQRREIESHRQIIEDIEPDVTIKDINGNDVHFGSQESSPEPEERYISSLAELHNTLRGRIYDSSGAMIEEVPIRELIQKVQDAKNASTIVFDGIITQRLIELANKKGVVSIYGIRSGQIARFFDGMLLYTKEQGSIRKA